MGIEEFMVIYEDVFNPIVVILAIFLFLLFQVYKKCGLGDKIRFFLMILFPSYFAMILYYLFLPQKPDFLEDVIISSTYFFSFGLIILGYRENKIKEVVFNYFFLLFLGSIPYLFISPFWNISGHVLFVELPILYLILNNRSFLPFFLIPSLMVFNRPIVGAHTWSQVIFTFFFAFVIFLVFIFLKKRYIVSKGKQSNL